MTLRDLLRKKQEIEQNAKKEAAKREANGEKQAPYQTEFTFLRTTTAGQEVIQPPTFPGDQQNQLYKVSAPKDSGDLEVGKKRRSLFSHHRSHSKEKEKEKDTHESPERNNVSRPSLEVHGSSPQRPKLDRKLSDRLSQLKITRPRSLSRDSTSSNLPPSLPPAPEPLPAPKDEEQVNGRKHADSLSNPSTLALEIQWEARATHLALSSPGVQSATHSPTPTPSHALASSLPTKTAQSASVAGPASTATSTHRTPAQQAEDETTLLRAIALHESSDLPASTQLFGTLASPQGANMPLAQVLYGLALRHGWGVEPDPAQAFHFLSLAASTSAGIESAALKAGVTTGGVAKGELVLSIFELANCYRHGWGTERDPVAAREYYEVAANLGDVDALEEASWCWLEGFGGPKDRGRAARYLRLAEERGRRGVGNSWIWKGKYDPGT